MYVCGGGEGVMQLIIVSSYLHVVIPGQLSKHRQLSKTD